MIPPDSQPEPTSPGAAESMIAAAVQQHPAGREAVRIVGELAARGFTAVLAGGCVRDALLGKVPKDFDVATDATPESVRDVFGHRRTIAYGESFGVIGVLPSRGETTGRGDAVTPTEVATFRADGTYSDGRRPDSVTYGDAVADASRRDFTINGMFYDPLAGQIHDHVGGRDDLAAGRLRTIGDPWRRFDEDKLRMLRAIRFAATLEFSIEPATWDAITQHAATIHAVSGERIGAEMRRVLTAGGAADGLQRLVDCRLADIVWPGLVSIDDWDELARRLRRLRPASFESAAAVVLLSMMPVGDARELVARWKLSSAERRAIGSSIDHAETIRHCETIPWSALQPLLIDRDARVMVDVAAALEGDGPGVARARKEQLRTPEDLDPPPLLTGADLIAMGHRPGHAFKMWLAEARRMQLDGAAVDRQSILDRLGLNRPAD